jgi:hypothetical protein
MFQRRSGVSAPHLDLECIGEVQSSDFEVPEVRQFGELKRFNTRSSPDWREAENDSQNADTKLDIKRAFHGSE